MTSLSRELAEAWYAKMRGFEQTFQHMQDAPALFKAEYVEQVKKDFRNASTQAHFWSSQ